MTDRPLGCSGEWRKGEVRGGEGRRGEEWGGGEKSRGKGRRVRKREEGEVGGGRGRWVEEREEGEGEGGGYFSLLAPVLVSYPIWLKVHTGLRGWRVEEGGRRGKEGRYFLLLRPDLVSYPIWLEVHIWFLLQQEVLLWLSPSQRCCWPLFHPLQSTHTNVCAPGGTLLVHDIIVVAPSSPPVCLQMNNCLPFHSIPFHSLPWSGSWERGPEAGMGLVSANRQPGTHPPRTECHHHYTSTAEDAWCAPGIVCARVWLLRISGCLSQIHWN